MDIKSTAPLFILFVTNNPSQADDLNRAFQNSPEPPAGIIAEVIELPSIIAEEDNGTRIVLTNNASVVRELRDHENNVDEIELLRRWIFEVTPWYESYDTNAVLYHDDNSVTTRTGVDGVELQYTMQWLNEQLDRAFMLFHHIKSLSVGIK